jgi:ELWxxDGT repeat protein
LTDVNGALFFYADDGVHGRELWKSDGTPEGTQLVKDINPGIADSCDQIYEDLCWTELTEMSGMLFFSADDGVHGRALWKSDGTADGTVMVKDIAPNSNFDKVNVLTDVNGTLFFPAGDLVHSVELWKSDGTEAGTLLVKDIYPGGGFGGSSWPRGLTEVNGTLFFKANDGVHDVELWKSDGTPEGTVLVKDIWPGGNSGCCGGMTDVNGTLFFSANDGIHHHYELWKSDGTAEGTVLVKDIWPGGNSSSPSYLTDVNGTLLFSAEDGEHGLELWKSDSTPEGTVMVKDIYPEGDGSSPEELTAVNGTLFFSANDGVHGQELWALNVTDTNEPPTISGTQSGQHVNDNATIDPFTGVTISDPDDDTLKVIVSLNNANKGDLTNLSGFVEGPSGTYTFVGSPASATTTVRGLTFNPTENRKPPGGTDTTIFTISADDGKADPVTDDTTTVIATSINDPPAWNGTVAGQTVDDNATIDPFTGVTITDPDNNASLTVIVSLDDPDKGTLTNLGGFVEGPDGTYTFIGSPVASTTAIKSLTFAPTGGRVSVGETETTTFTISADDSFATPVTDDTTTVIVSPAGSTKKIYLPLATK